MVGMTAAAASQQGIDAEVGRGFLSTAHGPRSWGRRRV